MVENGFYNFLNWFDSRAWYPLGRIVGGTVSTYIIQGEGGLELLYKSMTNHEKLNQGSISRRETKMKFFQK